MNTHHLILGTAGHIDHGKSSLIRALTGTDPDRLPEEKARGMTIELGFAHLDLPHPDDPQQRFSLGIIDVPGHADFVKNMVAGVGGINVALIAVAADDSWMPQTEEHVQILSYLGVEHAVVALTKADLVEDLSLAELDIREHLEGTPFADAPIIPTSATTGSGLDQLRETLARVITGIAPPVDCDKPRLSVDRVFSVKGIGTVVTGTLIGGSFTRGQAAIVQPQGTETRIRTLQSHNCELDHVDPGSRTAVGLHQVAIASRHEKHGLKRGDVITVPGTGGAADALGVLIETGEREIAGQAPSSKPLRHGQWVRFHHGGAAHNARLFFAEPDRKQLPRGESAPAQLRFEEPVFAFLGDRFVLRDRGMRATLAGGIVLDPHARRRHYREPENAGLLAARAKAPEDPAVATSTRLLVDRVQKLDLLLRQSPFTPADIEAGVETLTNAGTAIRSGNWLLLASWWSELTRRAAGLIDAEHQSRPQATGLPLADLSASLAKELPDPELFDVLVKSLAGIDFPTTGKFIHRASHQANLPPALESAAGEVRRQLDADPLNPPGIKELTNGPGADQALRFLLESGEAIRLDPKVAISGTTYQSLVEKVRQFISANGPATASQLRDATGTTRRVLIPLLERLDTDRITIRNGDVRSLRS